MEHWPPHKHDEFQGVSEAMIHEAETLPLLACFFGDKETRDAALEDLIRKNPEAFVMVDPVDPFLAEKLIRRDNKTAVIRCDVLSESVKSLIHSMVSSELVHVEHPGRPATEETFEGKVLVVTDWICLCHCAFEFRSIE